MKWSHMCIGTVRVEYTAVLGSANDGTQVARERPRMGRRGKKALSNRNELAWFAGLTRRVFSAVRSGLLIRDSFPFFSDAEKLVVSTLLHVTRAHKRLNEFRR